MKSGMEISPCVNFVQIILCKQQGEVEFSFMILICIFFINFMPNIVSICEKLREVVFSALNHLITSEKNCLVQDVDY